MKKIYNIKLINNNLLIKDFIFNRFLTKVREFKYII